MLFTELMNFKDGEFTVNVAHSEEVANLLKPALNTYVTFTETRSSKSENANHYKISCTGQGVSANNAAVDRRGFAPPSQWRYHPQTPTFCWIRT